MQEPTSPPVCVNAVASKVSLATDPPAPTSSSPAPDRRHRTAARPGSPLAVSLRTRPLRRAELRRLLERFLGSTDLLNAFVLDCFDVEIYRRLRDQPYVAKLNELLADTDPAADTSHFGAVGFCMSGGLALSVARARPDRLAAVASIHGAWLVRDTPDSPHLGLDPVRAEVHFAWVAPDPTAPEETIAVMEQALTDAGVTYTIDRETDAQHGFAPAGPRYDEAASERHWARVLDLFDRTLR